MESTTADLRGLKAVDSLRGVAWLPADLRLQSMAFVVLLYLLHLRHAHS